MFAWIDAMPLLEKIFFYMALPATLVMLIQTILLFTGGAGDTGLDSDTSGIDMDIPDQPFDMTGDIPDIGDITDFPDLADAGLQFITLRGIITFLTVFGWSGVCLTEMGTPQPVSVTVSILLGIGAMVGVAFLVRALMSLQASGNINYREALGRQGDVYLTIPPKGEGQGKVTLVLGGALSQYDAITEHSESIKTGEVVRITDIVCDNVMVVEREHT